MNIEDIKKVVHENVEIQIFDNDEKATLVNDTFKKAVIYAKTL